MPAPGKVQTVLGPIDAGEVGRTLVHEHLYLCFAGGELDPAAPFDRPAFILDAVRRLRDLKAHGVSTFVDPCPIELGRDPAMMAEISEKSEMHIVCTTGFYNQKMGLPGYWRVRSERQIADFYLHEITHGIGGTGIRPGAIKCATSAQVISPLEEKFLAAACIAHRESGLPLITHTEHIGGPEQQDVFERNGVPLQRCLIGHCCGNADPVYHRAVAVRGSYIGFDRIGIEYIQPDAVRADNIRRLVDGGFLSQILLSQDRYCHIRGGPTRVMTPQERAEFERMKASGEWPRPYTDLFTRFLPLLRERGISEVQIGTLLDRNPVAFLTGTA